MELLLLARDMKEFIPILSNVYIIQLHYRKGDEEGMCERSKVPYRREWPFTIEVPGP